MATNTLRLVSSTQKNSRVMEYETTLKKAEDAYLHGKQMQATENFFLAFDISISLIESLQVTRVTIRRVVEACCYCFDFCPLPEDSDEHFFLEKAGESLAKIIASNIDQALRTEALIAFKKVTELATELVNYNQSIRAQTLLCYYRKLRSIYRDM